VDGELELMPEVAAAMVEDCVDDETVEVPIDAMASCCGCIDWIVDVASKVLLLGWDSI
jgi:hypothetical protein